MGDLPEAAGRFARRTWLVVAGALCLALLILLTGSGVGRAARPAASVAAAHGALAFGSDALASVQPTPPDDALSGGLGSRAIPATVPASSAHPRLLASYGPTSIRLLGSGWSGDVGLGEVGRSGRLVPVSGALDRSAGGALYRDAGIEESFRTVPGGIEQSFTVSRAPSGAGALAIHVDLAGLEASGSSNVLVLRSPANRAVGTYGGLRVTDADGHVVPASMHAAQDGHAIVIDVADRSARYPLRVDPTFGPLAEVTDPADVSGDDFGYSVAVSGTTAVVGSPGNDTAYVYSIAGGTWTLSSVLVDPAVPSTGDDFGTSVAISGTTIVIGDPDQAASGNSEAGAAYVFGPSGSSWVLTAELTAPDGMANANFGYSVAATATTIAVGAPYQGSYQGAIYVYDYEASDWIQNAELTPSDSGPFDEMGFSVAISSSGDTIAGGALNGSFTGAAYVFTTVSGVTWTQAPKIVLPVSDASYLPATVAASDSTVLVGDQYSDGAAGAAYVYTPGGGGAWTLATTLTAADGGGFFGRALALSGSTLVVGGFGHNFGSGNDQGAAYVFTGSGAAWTQQTTDLSAADGASGDYFGFSVAVSGNTIVSGAFGHTVDGVTDAGSAYLFGLEVQSGPVFTVTTAQDTNDGACYVGDCSLRDAIDAVDAEPAGSATDQIQFAIPGSGVQEIQPTTSLPAITHPVDIDATTEPGFAGSPVIQLDGGECATSPCDGLDVDAGQSTVRGLAVTGFSGNGIALSGSSGNAVEQDWIGWSPLASGFDGNELNGIAVVGSSGNQIGGTAAPDRVVVAGNGGGSLTGADILISGAGSSGNVVEGSWIGLGADGASAGDDRNGVLLNAGATDNTIGGGESVGNVIYGTYAEGVYVTLAGPGNVISGNTIGETAAGVLGSFAAASIGITVQTSPGTTIGDDATPGSEANTANGNVIVGQTGYAGIFINSSGTTVAGNDIGTNRTAAPGLGNRYGVFVASGSGVVIGPGNTIANNSSTGVTTEADGAQITANSISGNSPGILTNGDVAAPVLTAPSPQTGAATTINGTVTAAPGAQVTVEFYDSPACDASGSGEGTEYLGAASTTIGAGGTAPISVASALPAPGDVITATATTTLPGQTAPSTSQFSTCSSVIAGAGNTSWTTAQTIPLNSSGAGSATASIDLSGEARWYKIPVSPDGTVQVNLTNVPASYDLALFSDIGQAEASLTASSTSGLQTLSAELPGSSFSPSEFSPSEFSPSEFSPSEFSPSEFSPSEFSPSEFSPSEFSPSEFSPSEFSPSEFSPAVISPSEFSPSEFSPSEFSPSEFSPSTTITDEQDYEDAQIESLLAVSDNGGDADQSIGADIWNNTGYFYIRVNGDNGAYDPGANFSLSVQENSGTCAGVAPSTAPLLASSFTVPSPSYQTLILTDESRMTDDGDLSTMESDLQKFSGLSSVDGTIVDVGTISPRVEALQTQADANTDCPYAENLVADAIRDVADAVWAQNSGLKYIVIIGDDHVIPFFRYPDQAGIGPESGYAPPVLNTTASFASLESDNFLSQDAYGASTMLDESGVEIPVPDLPVGRLVETPTEIDGMLKAYMSLSGGVVATPTSSLVTGYDFMTQSADAVEADLQAGLGAGAANDTLITNDGVAPSDTGTPPTQSWTASELESKLLGSRHDIIYLAGHFSANNLLAADESTTMNATQLADSSVNLENSIVFSAGCHSGYNIVAGDAVPGVTQTLDWVGAFAQKQATLIAGTGYQYGDTDFLAYSDQLYADFSHELRYGSGPVAVGTALVDAEGTYLDTASDLQGIDVKSILEATLYGLPMLSVDLPAGRIAPPTSTSVVASTTPEASGPGATLGLSSTDVTLSPTLTTNTVPLQNVNGSAGPTATYLSGPSGVSASPAQPTLPLASSNVDVSGEVLRGVGFIGGTYSDASGITPLTGAPTTELSGVHSTFSSSGFFPSRVWSVNYFGGLTGGPAGTQLELTPAQYESDAPGSATDTQRSYSSVGLRLFYSANTSTYGSNTPALAAPPTIEQVGATASGGTVTFQTHIVGDPSAGIQQVWVTYSGVTTPSSGTGEWQSLNLTQNATDSTLWTGTLSGLSAAQIADLRFVVQAVNGVGLVSLDDDNGAYYEPGQISGGLETGQGQTASALALNAPPTSGSYGSAVPVSATLTEGGSPVAGATLTFTIGGSTTQAVTGSNGVAQAQVQLNDLPGSDYQLTVAYAGTTTITGSSATTASFTINRLATTLALSGPSSATLGASTGITATLQAGGVGLMSDSVAFVFTPTGGGTPVIQTAITALGGVAQLGTVPLASGTYSVQAFFGPGGPIALPSDPVFLPSQTTTPFPFTVVGQPPAIQSASTATFTIGSAGNFTVTTTGIPTNAITDAAFTGCSPAASLPSGVTLTDNHNDTATLAGTPAAGTAGTYVVCLTAANGVGTAATQAFTLTVARVTPTTPTIGNLPASGTYGGGFTATVTTNGDGARSVTSSTPTVCKVAGGTQVSFVGVGKCTLTAQLAQGATYAAAAGAAQSVTIAPAALTITASSPSMTFGSTVPAITPTYKTFVNGDTSASLSTAPACTTTATSSSAPGTYSTSCSGAVDPDYTISYVAGTLTVSQATTTLASTSPPSDLTQSTFVPAASLTSAASACQTGQPVAFTLNVNPSTGAAGPYTLESATTTAAGVATGASISTATWVAGNYTVTATFAGTTGCMKSVASSALSVTKPTSVEYNDHGSSNITYAGTWAYSGANYSSADYEGDETWSDTAGSSVTVTFTGTSVEWITSDATNHGYANVYLDGTLVASNIDTHGTATTHDVNGYSVSGLADTSHTLKIVVDGTKDSAASGTYVSVDAFVVSVAPVSVQSIAFTSTPPAVALMGGTYSAAAAATPSGLPVTLSVDSTSTSGACSISGGSETAPATVTLTGPGECVIDANQAGNASYNAAPGVQQSFVIATPVEYNDHGSSNVVYSGSWTYSGPNYSSGDFDGDETWSDTAGSSVTVTFTGTSVEWITAEAPNHGYANIYLDGALVASNVDTHATGTTHGVIAYTAGGLADAAHTLKIVVDGTKDSAASGTYVSIDAFVVGEP